VHRLRAAQVTATLEALDDMRELALSRWQAPMKAMQRPNTSQAGGRQ
jgi:hypothetical protein